MADKEEVVSFRISNEGKLQASDWLAKLDRGALTHEERRAFTKWLAENPKNSEEIKSLASMWYSLDEPLSKLGLAFPSEAGLRGQRLGRLFSTLAPVAYRVQYIPLICIAFFCAFLGYLFYMPSSEIGYFSTNIGETRRVELSDGSNFILNTNSIIEQQFFADERIIRLVSGEAIFNVAHDKRRPFYVYASDGVIRSIGTKFSVRVEGNKVSVTVAEGAIELQERPDTSELIHTTEDKGSIKKATLEPVVIMSGQVGEITRTSGVAKQFISSQEVAERLSWEQGQLIFYERELQSVVDEVARYTTVEIQIGNESLKHQVITGILDIGDVDIMLEGIEGALDVKADRVSPDLVYLVPRTAASEALY
ncbi:FecR family protein [Kordiimonas pumila]|uniref:FecR family protein n=1 Tax=Kordiimonas pumila TaxID=2161677 RepID=A0ABV7D6M2_9PROT|nr:FecR domain-containing protein [Kordiimonas pumila]